MTRQYTPISPPDEDGSFAVLIKVSSQHTQYAIMVIKVSSQHTQYAIMVIKVSSQHTQYAIMVICMSYSNLSKLYKDGRVSEMIRAWAVGTVTCTGCRQLLDRASIASKKVTSIYLSIQVMVAEVALVYIILDRHKLRSCVQALLELEYLLYFFLL